MRRAGFPRLRGSGSMRFCGMALLTANPGDEEAVTAAALDHAAALLQQPGCERAYVLRERGTRNQVAISIFESEGAFQRATEATRSVLGRHQLDRHLEGPPTFRLFDVR